MRFTFNFGFVLATVITFLMGESVLAEPPSVSYVFPAGGQRGTKVEARIGGHFLFEAPAFEMTGEGITFPTTIKPIERIWFEGPLIHQPPSQRKEDYPRDYGVTFDIAENAPLGVRRWRTSTSQGITPSLKFVVGHLPEIVEVEIDGDPVPVKVTLPVTINGRTFPREDVDIWTLDAKRGEVVTCEVNAARIGSPVDSHLIVYGPSGELITENVDYFGTDSFLRFTAPVDGEYAVHIHDMEYGGLQHHVYRLTISNEGWIDHVYPLGGQRGTKLQASVYGVNLPKKEMAISLPEDDTNFFNWQPDLPNVSSKPIRIDLSEHPELLDTEPNNSQEQAQVFSVPNVLNGRIDAPGDVDLWVLEAKAGEIIQFELFASRLGSSLDSVLTILDKAGRQISKSDDMVAGQTDSKAQLKVPVDGKYFVQVTDRLETRGGERFAYRLYATPAVEASAPSFEVFLPEDALTIAPGGQIQVQIDVARRGGFQEEIELSFENLPEGITLKGNKIGKNRPNTKMTLAADETVKPGRLKVKLIGKGIITPPKAKPVKKEKGKPPEEEPKPIKIIRQATVKTEPGEKTIDELTLAVAVATPFKFYAPFETKYAARGSVYVRRYQIDRGGFEGPIEINMADRQNRHLQGVTGPTIVVPPGKSEFDYPITLAPWMEIGRTSRTCLAATAVVEDKQGNSHTVSYTSQTQDDQIIVLVDPLRLTLTTDQSTVRAVPGRSQKVTVQVGRDNGLSGDVTVKLTPPAHMRGVTAKPLIIPAGSIVGELELEFAEGQMGPFNAPLVIRAQMLDERRHPLTTESKLEVVE